MSLFSTIASSLFGGGSSDSSLTSSSGGNDFVTGGLQVGNKVVGGGSASGSQLAGEIPASAYAPGGAVSPWSASWLPAAIIGFVLVIVLLISRDRR